MRVSENIWFWPGGARSKTFFYLIEEIWLWPVMQIGDVIDGRPGGLNTASRFSQRTNNQWTEAEKDFKNNSQFLNVLLWIKS